MPLQFPGSIGAALVLAAASVAALAIRPMRLLKRRAERLSPRLTSARFAPIASVVNAAIARHELQARSCWSAGATRRSITPRSAQRAVQPAARADDGGHDLRSRVAHKSRRDDDERDAAGGAGAAPTERPRGAVHRRFRQVRQARHHDPPSAHSHVRTAAGSRARASSSPAPTKRSAARRRKCRSRRLANGSSTATSISSCSAPSSNASAVNALDRYASRHVFQPLGMNGHDVPAAGVAAAAHRADRTMRPLGVAVQPARTRRSFAASCTIRRPGAWVAWPATPGCSARPPTCRDFCRMLLGGGRLGRVAILSPLTVARMTAPATPASMRDVRGLGWDIDSTYSANRGELFPIGRYGHTGFTGTSLWLDPSIEELRRSSSRIACIPTAKAT